MRSAQSLPAIGAMRHGLAVGGAAAARVWHRRADLSAVRGFAARAGGDLRSGSDCAGARGARADRGGVRSVGVPGTAGCGRGRCRRMQRCGVTVWGAAAAAGRSWRGSGVLARRERGGMVPGIGACGRLRPGGRGRAQGAGSRWWVPGGPGPVLELPTRLGPRCWCVRSASGAGACWWRSTTRGRARGCAPRDGAGVVGAQAGGAAVRSAGAELAGASPKRARAAAWTEAGRGLEDAGVGSGWSGTAA